MTSLFYAPKRPFGFVLTLFALSFATGCTDTAAEVPLRSLQAGGAVSFLCVGADGSGREMRECPDRASSAFSRNRMLGLVTQTLTGEVAVVDLTRGGVVDVNPSVPGYSFLPVGARPTDIVSTPEGQASFVAVSEPGREGIFALPTSCVEQASDVSQWPACALPSAPGKLFVLIDPPRADGSVRKSCLSAEAQSADPPAASRQACAADLTRANVSSPGRRKLAVLLPDQGALAVLDAQSLVDREPGSFSACEIEAWLPLKANRPLGGVEQPLPADLVQPAASSPTRHYDLPGTFFTPRPSDLTLADTTLYVSDRGAPVIHRIDVGDPCAPSEQPSLLPVSFRRPERSVTTTKIAASPLTSKLERFLYAIDEHDEPAASVMVFDISPGSSQVTPIVRPGSTRMPLEEPDRISFTAPAADVVFANHDLPITDPETGIGVSGTRCDPNPDPSLSEQPGAKYRPASNLRSGAGPTPLRGTFGFVLLSSGQIAVLDVDDVDAACRRPGQTQASTVEDFRGCKNDGNLPALLTEDGSPNTAFTVTNEASCHVVEPHRVRSAQTMVNRSDFGVRSPSLAQFPVLSRFGSRLATNQTETGTQHPRLLPADFSASTPAEVFVGNTLYVHAPNAVNLLDADPTTNERNGITLPLNQPRSFPFAEDVAVTFEGALSAPSPTGFLRTAAGGLKLFVDENALFCEKGVQSRKLMVALGAAKFGLQGEALAAFAGSHADYAQVVSDFPAATDPYWSTDAANICSHTECRDVFGPVDGQTLALTRDFRIEEAYHDQLSVVPRTGSAATNSKANCCFPGAVSYVLRGGNQWVLRGSNSGVRHRIAPQKSMDGRFECALSSDPAKAFFESRVFEVSANPNISVCKYAGAGALPAESACVFNGLTARFVIYQGAARSERDMVFSWRTIGGFSPMLLSFGGSEASFGRILPVAIEHLSGIDQIGIVDGSTLGLTLIDLLTPQGRSVSFF